MIRTFAWWCAALMLVLVANTGTAVTPVQASVLSATPSATAPSLATHVGVLATAMPSATATNGPTSTMLPGTTPMATMTARPASTLVATPSGTPTAAPSASATRTTVPTATVAPSRTAHPTPVAVVSTRRVRNVFAPATCSSTLAAPTDACPITMKAVVATPPDGDTVFRAGDVVRVDIALATVREVRVNAVQISLDFPIGDLRLVVGPSDQTAIPITPPTQPVAPVLSLASGTFGLDAAVLWHQYIESGSGDSLMGHIDLDIGPALPEVGSITPAVVVPGADTIIATAYFRVARNVAGPVARTITVRDSTGAGVRFGTVVLDGVASSGLNALGPVSSGVVALGATTARFSLVPAAPAAGIAQRIGDVVPVSLVVEPVTSIRNARTILATGSFDLAELLLVGVPSDGSSAPPPPVAPGASSLFASSVGSVLASNGVAPTITTRYTEANGTGTLAVSVTGAPLTLKHGDAPRVVATLFVRPRHRGTLTLGLGMVAAYEPVVGGSAVAWAAQSEVVATAPIPDVRGTIGVGLAATLPAATADGTAPTLVAGVDGLGIATGATVTDGRAIDVEVSVLAGQTDVTGADCFAVDLTYDPSVLDIPDTPVVGTDVILAGGYIADGSTAAVVSTPGTLRLTVRQSAGGVLDIAAPIARVRFIAKSQGSAVAATGTFALGVGANTDLRRSGSQAFASSLYDNGGGAQTLDRLPVVVRQKPASLTVDAIVQGRNVSDPDSRFVQTLRLSLRRSGELVSPVRRYQPGVPATVATTVGSASPVDVMRYVATSARKAGVSVPIVSATLPDLEPGTYDVLVKGRSSVTVKILGVTLMAGGALTAPASTAPQITLPEGDADGNDAVNGADFAVLSRTFGTTSPESDLNQSGYVDAFDFALMARNYGLSGPVALATLAMSPALPVRATVGVATATYRVTLTLPPGLELDRARVVIGGTASLPATCPPTLVSGTTCSAETETRVRLQVTGNGGSGAGGTVIVGDVSIAGAAIGTANLTVTLTDAVGHDPAAPTVAVPLRAPTLSSSIAVDPSATYRLAVVANADGSIGVSIGATVAAGVHATAGRATIAYDAALLTADAVCIDLVPGVTCDASVNGRVTFAIDPASADLQGDVASIGTVRLVARPAAAGTAAILGTIDDLADTVVRPGYRTRLVTTPASVGVDAASATVSGGVVSSAAMRPSSVRVSTTTTVHAKPPGQSLSLAVPSIYISPLDGAFGAGSVVPVEIGVATGGQAIDAVQAVLAIAPGYEVVTAAGAAADSEMPLSVAEGSPWPVALHQRFDALSNRIDLAFARQVGGGLAGVVGDGTVGTILLRVNGGARTGVAVSVEAPSLSGFGSGLAVAGSPVAFTAGSLTITVSDTAPVVVPDRIPAVVAPVGPEIAVAPWANAVSAEASTQPGLGRSGTKTSAGSVGVASHAEIEHIGTTSQLWTDRAVFHPESVGWHEDPARGVIVLEPAGGTSPIELRTGLSGSAPDAWCEGPRYRTYIRLHDVGLSGATFGVGDGGVLDWVTPDRAGCVDWGAFAGGAYTFTSETIMQFRLAGLALGALLWVRDGARLGELYEVGTNATATYVTAEAFATDQAHYRELWANVIPVSTAQLEDVAARGMVAR